MLLLLNADRLHGTNRYYLTVPVMALFVEYTPELVALLALDLIAHTTKVIAETGGGLAMHCG